MSDSTSEKNIRLIVAAIISAILSSGIVGTTVDSMRSSQVHRFEDAHDEVLTMLIHAHRELRECRARLEMECGP